MLIILALLKTLFFREGLGSTFGTFGGKTDYFSRKEKEGKPYEHEKPNVKTNPPKKGTGYGLVLIFLNTVKK